jgi:hypothetical protein
MVPFRLHGRGLDQWRRPRRESRIMIRRFLKRFGLACIAAIAFFTFLALVSDPKPAPPQVHFQPDNFDCPLKIDNACSNP